MMGCTGLGAGAAARARAGAQRQAKASAGARERRWDTAGLLEMGWGERVGPMIYKNAYNDESVISDQFFVVAG